MRKAFKSFATLCFIWACFFCSPTLLLAKLSVVVSFSILQDLTQEVAGDLAQVETLVGPNSDAHVFEPTPRHAQKVAQADLILMNGLGFETWMTRLIEGAGAKAPVHVASQGLEPLMQNGVPDPHIWHDVAQMPLYVQNIAKALGEVDPAHQDQYKARAKAYVVRLKALHDWVRAQWDQVPEARRKVITAHDAFGYMGRRYHVIFMAPQGLSTLSEPSAKEMKALVGQIRKEGVARIYMENMASAHLIQQLAQETGVQVGEVLYSDALSEKNDAGNSYENVIRHNMKALMAGFRR